MEYNNNKQDLVWFAMSAPYCRELEAKRLLDNRSIENFIPMCYKVSVKQNKKTRVLVPAIHNLIFVRTTRTIIKETKQQISILQYITRTDNGKNIPVIVPDMQMQQFITVSKTNSEQLIYLRPEEINLKKGTRVRILGGYPKPESSRSDTGNYRRSHSRNPTRFDRSHISILKQKPKRKLPVLFGKLKVGNTVPILA